jgi:aspartate aminotransferase
MNSMTSYAPSANIAQLRESATIAASTRAKALRAAGRPVIDLGAGEPDFPTPAFVMSAAGRALDEGATRYTQVEGILPLREVIASRASAMRGGEPITPDQIVVTAGTKQALFNACFSLFGVGDEVLVPTPGWTSYYEMLALARATPVAVRGARERQLKVTPSDLAAAETPRTRGLILNSPCNPTGAVYSRAELRDIAAYAAERDWWILSDEIYRAISYDGEAPSLLSIVDSMDRLVVVDGVAKSFAMTGWRIGWSIAPRPLSRSMAALQSHTTSNAATISQHAALAALSNAAAATDAIGHMVGEFRRRRDAALDLLRRASIEVIEPQGAFYLYIRIAASTAEDAEPGTTFARRLLEEHDVAVVPGAAFRSPEWIRVSYAAPAEQVMEGVRRIIAARISWGLGISNRDGNTGPRPAVI